MPGGGAGLIPPGEMFGRVLPGCISLHADKPFEQRVEMAFTRLKAQFAEHEQKRLRQMLCDLLKAKEDLTQPTSKGRSL